VASISCVQVARSRGSTFEMSLRIRSRSSTDLPQSFVVRNLIRRRRTSAGALRSTTASQRWKNRLWFDTVPDTYKVVSCSRSSRRQTSSSFHTYPPACSDHPLHGATSVSTTEKPVLASSASAVDFPRLTFR